MNPKGAFAAWNLAVQCDGPDPLPCPEAMIIFEGQEGCFCVDRHAYLARCQRYWNEYRYYPAVGYAVLFCTHNQLPIPDWLAEVVNEAMLIAFEHGGRTENRRAGGYKPQARRLDVHRQRWELARAYKLVGLTDDEAFERASEELRGTAARSEARQIEESYRRIQRRAQTGTAKSGK